MVSLFSKSNQMLSNTYPDIAKACATLIRSAVDHIETTRRLRVLACLLSCSSITSRTLNTSDNCWGRYSDGGWSDVEESMWAITSLDLLNGWSNNPPTWRNESVAWLNSQKSQEGAWGRSTRDMARIPVTGMLLSLLPEFADVRSLDWLENAWRYDLEAPVNLTYKGALFLSAFAKAKSYPKNINLITKTIDYLANEQNSDGGFSPWKSHPIGSEPWSTGIVLIGLTSFPELTPRDTLERALQWLALNQLPNGLWPCHYIEEGSAYCYWGAVEALKVLKRAGYPCAV